MPASVCCAGVRDERWDGGVAGGYLYCVEGSVSWELVLCILIFSREAYSTYHDRKSAKHSDPRIYFDSLFSLASAPRPQYLRSWTRRRVPDSPCASQEPAGRKTTTPRTHVCMTSRFSWCSPQFWRKKACATPHIPALELDHPTDRAWEL